MWILRANQEGYVPSIDEVMRIIYVIIMHEMSNTDMKFIVLSMKYRIWILNLWI